MRLLLALIALASTAATTRADDWMYRPSAYSHSPRWGHEVGVNRFSRGPYYGPQYGAFQRGGYRHLYGPSYGWGGWNGDYSNMYESWFQTGELYSY